MGWDAPNVVLAPSFEAKQRLERQSELLLLFCANLQAIVVEQPAKREKRDDSMSLAKIDEDSGYYFFLKETKMVGLD